MTRRRTLAVALAAFVALAAVSVVAAETTRTLKIEIPITGPFAVENLAGSFRVASGDVAAAVATATIHAETEALAAAVRFEAVSAGSSRATYRVRYPYDKVSTFRHPSGQASHESTGWLSSWFHGSNTTTTYDGRSVKISSSSGTLLYADVEVIVPRRELDGHFRNVVGDLQARELRGSVKFDTGGGDVALDSIEGKVDADTGSGNVQASRIRGSFHADTGSGDISLVEFDGDVVRFDVGSGDIQMNSVRAKKVNADTGSGDVEASDLVAESFDVDTGSGDVVLRGDGSAMTKITADTGSGDVTLELGPNASFEAIASQGSGDLVNKFDDAQPIVKGREVIGFRRGDGRTKITVETGSGDLVLEPGG